MKSINDRLTAAKKAAELSIADMGFWFGAQRRTMETWLRGVVPHEFRRSQIEQKLDLLEKAIKAGKHFPVPMSVTQYERKNYLQQALNAVSPQPRRVSKARSAK